MTRELTTDDVGKTFKDGFNQEWEIAAIGGKGPWPVAGRRGDYAIALFDLRGKRRTGLPENNLIIEDPPREVWVNTYDDGTCSTHWTKKAADNAAFGEQIDRIGSAVLFREVKEP